MVRAITRGDTLTGSTGLICRLLSAACMGHTACSVTQPALIRLSVSFLGPCRPGCAGCSVCECVRGDPAHNSVCGKKAVATLAAGEEPWPDSCQLPPSSVRSAPQLPASQSSRLGRRANDPHRVTWAPWAERPKGSSAHTPVRCQRRPFCPRRPFSPGQRPFFHQHCTPAPRPGALSVWRRCVHACGAGWTDRLLGRGTQALRYKRTMLRCFCFLRGWSQKPLL